LLHHHEFAKVSGSSAGGGTINIDMNAYLRHAKTRLYYSGWHSWTPDLQQATDFQNSDSAFQRAKDEQLNQVELVILEGDKETIIPIVKPTL